MRLVYTVADMVSAQKEVDRPLGLFPTLGALHDGHLSLVKRAREDNAAVAVSIFVNPTQFGPQEDLAAYPRDLVRDLSLLEEMGTDLVFIPQPDDMYPAGFDTWINVERTTNRLEGESRPDHFRGVATVVAKLFNIVRPDRAYFGQKDAQQVQVIRRMNSDLNLGVEIVVMPTVREPDDLAMSSRNAYLSPQERQAALVLYRALCVAHQMYSQQEQRTPIIREALKKMIRDEPMAQLDYVSIANPDTLDELEVIQGPALVSLAVLIGKTRLIDNMVLGIKGL
ncbi:MAG: pantoate--beta-alanine ligase [Dehalococcoidia bacterium]|jgi:pantoate--beta-alanine ligase|nr:pantoate--beta-alanine ligase [Dehalococcoidia bacterium]